MTKKKLYITTAIPYVNGTPHIGNALDYLLADIWARYQIQHGHEVKFQIGTDEHGNKIAQKAADAGLDPKSYTDQTHINFKNLVEKVGAQYTDFVRTTDSHHVGVTQYIWQKLQPYIYKGTYEGWYSVGEEAFVSDKVVAANNGISPDHGVPYQRLSEDNYYFKLSEFAPRIREAILNDKLKIVPSFRKQEMINLIDEGIEDLSVSRPKKSLSWGVPVPGDPTQVMYVWVDALSNYLTVIGYPDRPEWQDYWPADVQIVGKDIMRFHAIIWPAMLMALELPLPKQLLVHGHITSAGTKMSKTIGNVVDPNEVIDNYGVDAFRYFFSRHIPTLDDGDFTWEKFENAYNNELGNDLGNLVSRVSKMVKQYQSGVIGDVKENQHDMHDYFEYMKELEFDKAIDEVWNLIRSHNQYIERVKPWEIAKLAKENREEEAHLSEVLSHSINGLMQIAEMLVPFIPESAAKIKHIFSTGVIQEIEGGVLFPKIYIKTQDPRTKPRNIENKPAEDK